MVQLGSLQKISCFFKEKRLFLCILELFEALRFVLYF